MNHGLFYRQPFKALRVCLKVWLHAVRCDDFSCGKCDALLDIIDS